MVIGNETPHGSINISLEAIASVAGDAASECYGVVGLASKNSLRENINELLKKDDYVKGVYCRGDKKKGYEVGVYLYVAYGVKITEVVSEVQKKVRYVLEKTFSIPFKTIDVYVQDIKEIE
jgi:uncharacterized alkaline shock family protein YloU